MNSFNAFGQTEKKVGGNTPVWLGTVKPVPVGVKFTAEKGKLYGAGTPVEYNAKEHAIASFTEANANAYIYNDVYSEEGGDATCAIVMYHPEGLLIERVNPDITEEQIQQLQAKIPGVLLVRG